jgi:hypothetical protein
VRRTLLAVVVSAAWSALSLYVFAHHIGLLSPVR